LIAKKEGGLISSEIEMERERFDYYLSVWRVEREKYNRGTGYTIIGNEGMRSVIIGGDFNLKIGVLGKRGSDLEGMDRSRKDKCLGNGGRKFGLDHTKGMRGTEWMYYGRLGGRVDLCRSERELDRNRLYIS